jgi:ribosomal RNA-processing protein 1
METVVINPLWSALASSGQEPPSKRRRVTAASPPTYSNIISKCGFAESSSSIENLKPATPDDLRQAVLKAIFAVASQEETRDSNRKKLYAIWKTGMQDGKGATGEWDGS